MRCGPGYRREREMFGLGKRTGECSKRVRVRERGSSKGLASWRSSCRVRWGEEVNREECESPTQVECVLRDDWKSRSVTVTEQDEKREKKNPRRSGGGVHQYTAKLSRKCMKNSRF